MPVSPHPPSTSRCRLNILFCIILLIETWQAVLTFEKGAKQISASAKLCLHTLFLYNVSSNALEASISLHGLDFSLQEVDGEISFVRLQVDGCAAISFSFFLFSFHFDRCLSRSQKMTRTASKCRARARGRRHTSTTRCCCRAAPLRRDHFHLQIISIVTFPSGPLWTVARCARRRHPTADHACNTALAGAFLEKKSHGFLSSWQKRYFRVEGDLLCYYHEEPVIITAVAEL